MEQLDIGLGSGTCWSSRSHSIVYLEILPSDLKQNSIFAHLIMTV